MKILKETNRMIYAERPDGKKVILLKSYHKKTIRRIYRKIKTSVSKAIYRRPGAV